MTQKNIIRRPLVTEKLARLQGEGKDVSITGQKGEWFAFEVLPTANKLEIKSAVEELYSTLKIKVVQVRTQNCRGRLARTARGVGKIHSWKKAIVQLQPGQTLNQN